MAICRPRDFGNGTRSGPLIRMVRDYPSAPHGTKPIGSPPRVAHGRIGQENLENRSGFDGQARSAAVGSRNPGIIPPPACSGA
jgi:hypothetical protein